MRPGTTGFWQRAVRLACRFYPADFQRLLADDLAAVFAETHARIRSSQTRRAAWSYAVRTLSEILLEAVRARTRGLARRGGGVSSALRRNSAVGRPRLENVLRDSRQAFRRLAKSPGFALTALITLGIGIGSNASIFALANAVILQPLPYPDADRLVRLGHATPGMGGPGHVDMSQATFLHYRQENRTFDDLALYQEALVNVTGDGPTIRSDLVLVTPSFFRVLQVPPALGRAMTEEDGQPGAPIVVLLSDGLWRRRYGGDSSIVGRSVLVNGVAREIIGVMPQSFDFPRVESDMWMNMTVNPAVARVQDLYLPGVGRLRNGTTVVEAVADLNRLVPTLADAFPTTTPQVLSDWQLRATVTPLKQVVVGDVANALWILLGTMGFVLLVACANVANLFLVRTEHHQRDLVIRTALGASRWDVVRHLFSESVLLSCGGAIAGMLVAYGGTNALIALSPTSIPRLHEVQIDWWVIAFALVLSATTAVVLGTVATMRTRVVHLASTLKEGSRASSTGPRRQRLRQLLVVSQVTLALTLLVGAGLMAQSFWRLSRVDPGFDSEGVLTFEVTLPFRGYENYNATRGFFVDLLDRIRALPGVDAAGAVSSMPLQRRTWTDFNYPIALADAPLSDPTAEPVVAIKLVTQGYFRAMRIRTLEGDEFDDATVQDRYPVFVNVALAQRLFPGRSVVGQQVRRVSDRDNPWLTIRGVTESVRDDAIARPVTGIMYIPVLEHAVDPGFSPSAMTLAIRTSVPPLMLVPSVRRAVADLDSEVPLSAIRTMGDIVAQSTARNSFTMLLLLIAAGTALFLAAVGLYGVLSYTVGQRTHEIGVRMALGARGADVRRLIVGQGILVTAVGVALGFAAAWQLTALLRSLLFEVSPTDPLTFGVTAVVLMLVAALASYLPARRAAALDPVIALRSE